MKDLNSFIKDNMKFLKIEDGETVKFVYKGYSIIPDRFNPGRETISYLLQYPDSDKTVQWQKGSNKVAMLMNKINVGEEISIQRFGEGMGTKYIIKPVSRPLGNVNPDETPF